MAILVFNSGSSTVKYALFEPRDLSELASGKLETNDWSEAIRDAMRTLGDRRVEAIGHRVVHGGTYFRQPVLIDEDVKHKIAELSEFAPLHNPPALAGIDAADSAFPGVPQVAVFDTAFFSALPPGQHVYPVPWSWYEDWGVRRFGFHGISHQYCAARAAELLGRPDLRVVVLHLGNGCSGAAIRAGAPAATTMGFTPIEGLMMGTRSGSIDPGILLYVQRRHKVGLEDLDRVLNHGSGLLGVSGISSDFRSVEAAAAEGNERARLAIEIFAERARSSIGSLAAAIGGLDVLVFTGGIGEGSAALRANVCQGLEFLGIRFHKEKNVSCIPDDRISEPDSPACALVLRTREELIIAREADRLLARKQ